MINVHIQSEFLELLGLEIQELKELFNKSKNKNDFIEYLDIDGCVEQLDLNEEQSFEFKNDMISMACTQYNLLGRRRI